MTDNSLIRMEGVTKIFPGVVANDAVDFDLQKGEVHTLLGENGAGKSTLMSILSGMYQPDAGTLYIKGEQVAIRSPKHALELGIGMVYQHFALVPNLTVIENIVLGFEGGVVLNWKKATEKLNAISKDFGLSLDLKEQVQNLSVGEQQRIEILKILYHGSDALILDEPTSVLTPQEADDLFVTLDSLRKMGKAVVLITHKLHEALHISDRISVLKLGKKIAEFDGDELRAEGTQAASKRILATMFGEMSVPTCEYVPKTLENEVLIELKDVTARRDRGSLALKNVSLQIRKGEIYGLAGVDGNGQKQLCEVIGGQRPIESGQILFEGKDISGLGCRERSVVGIAHVTDDRMGEGCVTDMTLAENSILREFYRMPYSRFTVIDNSCVFNFTTSLIGDYNVKATGPNTRAGTLSGGNLQKFLLARELAGSPSVIVCNKPTQGLDAWTVAGIQERLKKVAESGAAVLLVSSDLDELLNNSDRIGVMYDGQILDTIERCDATPEGIGKLMLGHRE